MWALVNDVTPLGPAQKGSAVWVPNCPVGGKNELEERVGTSASHDLQ